MHVTPSAVYLMIKKPVARQVIRSCLIICLKKNKPMEADQANCTHLRVEVTFLPQVLNFPFLERGKKMMRNRRRVERNK